MVRSLFLGLTDGRYIVGILKLVWLSVSVCLPLPCVVDGGDIVEGDETMS